jgi:DNA polymerase III alpha subunit|tara:strand:- start:1104 stop:1655 length:552 start_codon:yes stop_codon:yes gene_type:complete
VIGNQKSSKINRNIDQYGRVIYDVYDLYDMVMSGVDTSKIKEVSWNQDFEKYNHAIKKNYVDNTPELEKLSIIQLDVEEFDRINQQTWFIPDEYKNLDIKSYVLERTPDHAVDRVNEELNLYDKYNIIDVLKVCIYIIDTLRKNNIVWGVGRGSSVASYVLYLIGVHKVDSIKYELDINEFLR